MSGRDANRRGNSVFREMRVAHVRERKGAKYLEVMFMESARIYKLFEANPAFGKILGCLRAAEGKNRKLKVRCASVESDVIEEVQVYDAMK
jgi:hypothetical protein